LPWLKTTESTLPAPRSTTIEARAVCKSKKAATGDDRAPAPEEGYTAHFVDLPDWRFYNNREGAPLGQDFGHGRAGYTSYRQIPYWQRPEYSASRPYRRGAPELTSDEPASRSYAGVGPKGYQRPDERIWEDVCELLMRHDQLDASQIEVKVKNGEVTLQGMVESRWAKRLTEDLADSISGVKDVINQLRINQEPAGQPTQAAT
jgi:hypothetical protein